jgi:hypothetical protein
MNKKKILLDKGSARRRETIMKSTGINVGVGVIIGIAVTLGAMNLIGSRHNKPPAGKIEERAGAIEAVPLKEVSTETGKIAVLSDPVAEMPSGTEETDEESELQRLMDKVWSGTASPDEELEFWRQLRESDEINNIIKDREQNTPLESEDIGEQMNLAELYVAKIYSASAGPEMGLWAMKAEQRWRAVLEMDPNHWQAQNNVAFSLSQYPDYLNKTGESINEYEKLVTIQENTEPQPQHADTYLALYRLYEKRGDRGNAVDALKQGLEQFPSNTDLVEQWNSVSTLNIP